MDYSMYCRNLFLVRRAALAFGGIFFLTGCALTADGAAPALTNAAPASGQQQAARTWVPVEPKLSRPLAGIQLAASDTSGAPNLGTGTFESPGVTPGQPSGTHVGQKVDELRGDLARLQGRMADHNAQLQAMRGAAREGASA